MARVLVTGAAGFVTVNVVRALAARGHEVVALDRRPPDEAARSYAGPSVRWSVGDVRDAEVLGRVFKTSGAEILVHGAAVTATTPEWERERAADVLGVNVLGTINALTAAHAAGVQRVIVVSSASAIGPREPGEAFIPEGAAAAPRDLYGISKRALELVAERLAELNALAVVAVRLSQPYGPMERPSPDRAALSPIAEWITAAREGRFLTTPSLELTKDWIYIDDVAEAFARLVEARVLRYTTYNLGLGESVTVARVMESIRLAWPAIEVSVMPGWRPNPNLAGDRLRPPLAMTRLAEDVGFRPEFSIERGIAAYAAWTRG
ncbi:MAG TPA: NAD(P)-dependent oxidoreductase [Methylomirabilota bacterium]|jgi:UDP-glucose 4-epimerase|nr:NAD(P)-dependent oxidoreductase [Methylomirabilota bacterium]